MEGDAMGGEKSVEKGGGGKKGKGRGEGTARRSTNFSICPLALMLLSWGWDVCV